MNTKLYTGTGSSNAITGVGFQPDWTWIKSRTSTHNNQSFDAVRGVQKAIVVNESNAEFTMTNGLTAFGTDGFTVGSDDQVNNSSQNYASWNWKANGSGSSNSDGSITSTVSVNTTAGFSIIKFTGTGSGGATIGHGLGVKPKIFLLKSIGTSEHWHWWQDTTGDGTADKRLILNSTATNYNNYFVTFGTNTITLPSLSDSGWSGNGTEYICYCFAEKTGYSKFGSYNGNANANGLFCYTGFAPSFLLIKCTSDTDHWLLADNKRPGFNDVYDLYPNLDVAEYTGSVYTTDILSNGFKLRSTDAITNGNKTYIYMAFGQSLVGSNNVPCTAR